MKYEVFITLTGYMEVEAQTPEEARRLAMCAQDEISWSDSYEKVFVQWCDADGVLHEDE